MLVNGKEYRTIWLAENNTIIEIIDQRFLPFEFVIEKISTSDEMVIAIKDMHLRGAPLIGAAASYGIYLACLEAKNHKNPNEYIKLQAIKLQKTRPTAINLKWAIDKQLNSILDIEDINLKINKALNKAEEIADSDVEICSKMGEYGVFLIEKIFEMKKARINILTHCNAGALACVDVGTATSSIYLAAKKNIPVHIWVDETRPRNQGKLTSWELTQSNIPNTVICDNTGGHLMQSGMVDIVIVGTDRTTAKGDVANKIGTYMKALAAADNKIPFYVALPSPSIDWTITEPGLKSIPIEERDQNEVLFIEGKVNDKIENIRLFQENTIAKNYGFDITPSRLITGFITENGICKPSELQKLFNIYYV